MNKKNVIKIVSLFTAAEKRAQVQHDKNETRAVVNHKTMTEQDAGIMY